MRTRRPGHPGGCDGALVEPSSLGTGRQVGKLSSNVDVKSTRPFAEKTKTSKLKLKLTKLGLSDYDKDFICVNECENVVF